jgi:acyl-CoA reductase-like NAD-dependent aldehyde dehydrogenase
MFYKDPQNKLHSLSPEDIAAGGERYLPAGTVPITNQEAEALRVVAITPEQIAAQAKSDQDRADAIAAKADAKLQAIASMTPVQVRAWVAANVTNLADAKDALATMAVCVSVLARKL